MTSCPATRSRGRARRRRVEITYRTAFPHRIEGWRELSGERVLAEAERTHTEKSAYWSRNGNRDLPMREKLGLGDTLGSAPEGD